MVADGGSVACVCAMEDGQVWVGDSGGGLQVGVVQADHSARERPSLVRMRVACGRTAVVAVADDSGRPVTMAAADSQCAVAAGKTVFRVIGVLP